MKLNVKWLLATIVMIGLAMGMMMGKVQTVIGFEDEINEIVFTWLLMMGVIAGLGNIITNPRIE